MKALRVVSLFLTLFATVLAVKLLIMDVSKAYPKPPNYHFLLMGVASLGGVLLDQFVISKRKPSDKKWNFSLISSIVCFFLSVMTFVIGEFLV